MNTKLSIIELDVLKTLNSQEGATQREMKKLVLMLAAASMAASVSAQTVAESKTFDNIYVGINGGVVETVVGGVPVGLGSYVQWDRKLDARLAQAVVSINAFKGVEFGLGFKAGYLKGSQVMDEILWSPEDGYTRRTNNLGGFEGGMTNGQPIVVRGVMKPIPTLYKPLMSVDIETHEPYKATVERSDPTALPAAGVVMEAVVATVLAQEILEKFSSDNLEELKEAVTKHREYTKNY